MNREKLDDTPIMTSVPRASRLSGLSQYCLRQLIARNDIPHLYSGNKVYLNYPALAEMLNDPERVKLLSISTEKSS